MKEEKEYFTSRWSLILSVLGMAIGAGNIWRFPRLAAQNGGGSFLIPWLLFLFLWSIPLIIAEFGIGKYTRAGVVGAFGKLVGRRFTWMGSFVGFCTMGIMFYYSVVMGWSLKYFVQALTGGLSGIDHGQFWESYTSSYYGPIFYHFLSILIGGYVIYRGVVRGIERANKILIPLLFLLLIMAAIRAITLPNAIMGLNYLFSIDKSELLDYHTWLEALSQSAWSTGAGWGLILTYAVYMKRREDIVLNSFLTGLGNNSASLIAGMAVIPTVFALSASVEEAYAALGSGNTGLTFIAIPHLFQRMPLSRVFSSLFFLALTFAALSSLISMIELATRIFMDAGISRHRAIFIVGSGGFLLGIPSAMFMGFFNNQDWTWGLGLLLSGFFVALAANKFGIREFRDRIVNTEGNDMNVGRWYDFIIKYLVPIEFMVLIGWWFWQSITVFDREGWWNPFHTYSIGTCIFQWGIALALFIAFNRAISKRMLGDQVKI
ncbi:MAG: sodium-dependent transporter [Fidelibacterota bacterium]